MQVKIASFLADNGLVPVLTTTPYVTKVLERSMLSTNLLDMRKTLLGGEQFAAPLGTMKPSSKIGG
jgi:hypothetical protein